MKFLLMVCSLAASIVQSADAVEFGHYAASAASLRPDIVPSTAKVWDSGDTAEASYVAWQWPQSNVEHVLRIRVQKAYADATYSPRWKDFKARSRDEGEQLYAQMRARRVFDVEARVARSCGACTVMKSSVTGNPDKGAIDYANYVLDRKSGKLGNYAYDHVSSGKGADQVSKVLAGNVTLSVEVHKDNLSIDEREAMINSVLLRLPRSGALEAVREDPVKPAVIKPLAVDEADPRGEVYVYPLAGLVPSERGLIPASDVLPAKIVIRGAKPNSVAEWTVRAAGGQLHAGAARGAAIQTRTDASGNTEAQFFYTGGTLKAPQEIEVTTMIAGRKHSAFVQVGLGLAFDRVRAIKGQDFANSVYAFTLSIKSVWRPQLNVQLYLAHAEESGAWGERRFGIRLDTAWLNRDGSGDQPFSGTAEIKPVGSGNALVATRTAEPTYSGGYHAYPAVRMGGDGRHVYSVTGTPVVMDYTGKVVAARLGESLGNNNGMVVISRDSPEGMLQSLSCAFEPQDWTQYLMLETAKSLPGGQSVEWFAATTSLICGFNKGEFEKSLLDMASFLGGKYLDHLDQPQVKARLSPKQRDALAVAKQSYDKIDGQKSEEERNKYLGEALHDFGLAAKETSIDASSAPEALPPLAQPRAPTPSSSPVADNGRENESKSLQDAAKDLEKNLKDVVDSFKDLKSIFTR